MLLAPVGISFSFRVFFCVVVVVPHLSEFGFLFFFVFSNHFVTFTTSHARFSINERTWKEDCGRIVSPQLQ